MGNTSQIEFLYMQFWAVLVSNHFTEPNFLDLFFTVHALINSEEKPDQKMLDRLSYIEEHTTERLNMPLAAIEYFYWKNAAKGLQTDLTIAGGKTMNIMSVFVELNKALKELTMMVVKIGKKYSLDITYRNPSEEDDSEMKF